MPREREPIRPLPKDYQPARSTAYRVKDGDRWETLAKQFNVLVAELIKFNFHTNNTDEVNWYLKRNVGCNISRDGMNWAFSSGASPGIIYIPIQVMNFDDADEIEGTVSTSPFAKEFESPSSPLDTLGKAFDIFQMLDIGLAIAGVSIGEVAMLGAGIVIAPIAPFVALGAPHEAALNKIRQDEMVEGLTLGIVLGADRRSGQWIRAHNFVKLWGVQSTVYPEYGKDFQKHYNTGLVAGLGHGRQFNTVARHNMFQYAWHNMSSYVKSDYLGDPPLHGKELEEYAKTWSERKREMYYRVVAATLRTKIRMR